MNDRAIGHCPKCGEPRPWNEGDGVYQCRDCGFFFRSDEVIVGVDPLV